MKGGKEEGRGGFLANGTGGLKLKCWKNWGNMGDKDRGGGGRRMDWGEDDEKRVQLRREGKKKKE